MRAIPVNCRQIDTEFRYGTGTNQASDFSITSSFTNASRHCWRETLVVRVGIGSVKYINALYVVEVYATLSQSGATLELRHTLLHVRHCSVFRNWP